MEIFESTMRFRLPTPTDNAAEFLDALYEAGCSDALVGIAEPGSVVLTFSRQAVSFKAATDSAKEDVVRAIPGAELVETIV